MKVLITGGAGYIGAELAYELEKDPAVDEILIYDNLSRGNYNVFVGVNRFTGNVRFVRGELLDSYKLHQVLDGVDVVYHLAAKVTTPFADQNPHEFEQTNNWGTAELVYAVEKSDVKRFVYLSSASVYGASRDEVNVDSAVDPRTFYGISKLRGEEHVARLFDALDAYIVRCGNVYGYGKSMRFDSVINRFMLDANCAGRISINGDGNQYRSFIHVERATNFLAKLVQAPIDSGYYDLVDDTFQINQVVDKLKDIYPGLEMIYVNHHFKLRELKVKPDPVVNGLIDIERRPLEQALIDFKQAFTF